MNIAAEVQNNSLPTLDDIGAGLKQASRALAIASSDQIESGLRTVAGLIRSQGQSVLDANAIDVAKAQENKLSPALIDRLLLNEERLEAIARGIDDIISLSDPVGLVLEDWVRPNGLRIQKISVPIGVIGMIYESRPNVTVDAAALCLRSRNAVLLRGGSESFYSSSALHALIQSALKKVGLPEACVSMVPGTDRALVGEMLAAHHCIDVIIPRGGKGLTERVMKEATMPVFAHLDGNCHVYIDKAANPAMAENVLINAKLRRTGICGAAESLLIHQDFPRKDAVHLLVSLLDRDVIIYGDETARSMDKRIQSASEADWSTEYLDKKISCKFVPSLEDAITHTNTYGSHHTDSIITDDAHAAEKFLKEIDSAIVLHNASTQFADGGEFGFGAEIGIGTGKLHARGPVGLRQLTTFKYILHGNGQTRS